MENNSRQNETGKINRQIKRRTILSFSVFLIAIVFSVLGWKWLLNQRQENGTITPLQKVLNINEKINSNFFSDKHLAPEFSKNKAAKLARVNGDIGLGNNFDPGNWRLNINRHPENSSPDSILHLTMYQLQSLPKRSETFEFKCIEGWSEITNWGGVKFSDFILKFNLGTHSGRAPDPNHPEDLYKYVGLITPDSAYYVGIDMKSMLQEQTILCYELNEKPLPENQGYPLRLIITVKYGIKNLKRIGTIFFSDTRPPDYWYERGYDYDAAL